MGGEGGGRLVDCRFIRRLCGPAGDSLFRRISVGLLSGGYGEDELGRAGAFRVYRDAAELLRSLDELGMLP